MESTLRICVNAFRVGFFGVLDEIKLLAVGFKILEHMRILIA